MRTCSIFLSVRSESAKTLMKERIQSLFFKEHEVLPCVSLLEQDVGHVGCIMRRSSHCPLSATFVLIALALRLPRPSVKAIKLLMWPAPARLNERLQSSPGLCKIPLIEVDGVWKEGLAGSITKLRLRDLSSVTERSGEKKLCSPHPKSIAG